MRHAGAMKLVGRHRHAPLKQSRRKFSIGIERSEIRPPKSNTKDPAAKTIRGNSLVILLESVDQSRSAISSLLPMKTMAKVLCCTLAQMNLRYARAKLPRLPPVRLPDLCPLSSGHCRPTSGLAAVFISNALITEIKLTCDPRLPPSPTARRTGQNFWSATTPSMRHHASTTVHPDAT